MLECWCFTLCDTALPWVIGLKEISLFVLFKHVFSGGAYLCSPCAARLVFVNLSHKVESKRSILLSQVCVEYSCKISIQAPTNNSKKCVTFCSRRFLCLENMSYRWRAIFEFIGGLIINVIILLNYTQHMHTHSNAHNHS